MCCTTRAVHGTACSGTPVGMATLADVCIVFMSPCSWDSQEGGVCCGVGFCRGWSYGRLLGVWPYGSVAAQQYMRALRAGVVMVNISIMWCWFRVCVCVDNGGRACVQCTESDTQAFLFSLFLFTPCGVVNKSNVFFHSINQTINQSIDQSIKQSINQSIDQSVHQSINQSVNQSVNQSIIHKINKSINQSTNPPINQSPNQPINQSTNQSIIQTTNHKTRAESNQSINQPISQSITQHAPKESAQM